MTTELGLLLAVRNGVAHLGAVSEADAKGILTPYLKASEALREELGFDRGDYWREFLSVVDSSLEEHVTEVRLHVETALAAARDHSKKRFGQLEDELRDAMFVSIEADYMPPETFTEDLVECPVCGRFALVAGNYSVDFEPDFDNDGSFMGGHQVATLHPNVLRCGVCQLKLHGEDELQAAGLPASWVLEYLEQADFREAGFLDI